MVNQKSDRGKEHTVAALPATRYYGSKRRQIGWIANRLRKYEYETVLDAFGGTGTVSLLLAQQGKSVSYHDSFFFNCASARALLTPSDGAISRDELENLITCVRPLNGFISRTYEGVFYPKAENQWLDGMLRALDESGFATIDLDIASYCLFQACLQKRPYNMFHRANLNLRMAKGVKRSFGNLTTWETPFGNLMLRAFDELVLARALASHSTTVRKPGPVMDIEPGFDLVYLDPPYMRSKTPEKYLNRYHFLEGLARRKEWPELILNESSCKFFRKDYLSEDWENPKTIEGTLGALVERHSQSIVALSYMEGGIPSVLALKRMFKRIFRHCSVHRMPVNYALSKRSNSEVLIIGRN